ncbi:MAG: BREX-1 system phosphatase PglZ type B [Leptolyngbya sp. PLA2]|nr:BREX-1 system phosphatase PglZ type B [Leptolyngbya sp.]MCE7971531.1 BREX-1 system phosphatase PglZ type B [Leptolyngbya sp. PL-A2]MCQ3940745.1 BREX-1 system phosphatase PglZ type B [cyanobacterium CYA1]MDL1903715.1 BREX-1 system phosphatase PglZ type B [Synechococcales cyanobacterium CNB]
MPATSTSPGSLLEAIIASLADAARHQPGVEEAPAAILWTDAKGEWRPLLPVLRERLPQLLTLGEYDPKTRTGPAIWIRCAIARTLDDLDMPADEIPIVYMPDVTRQALRAGDECPRELQPLVELQYRGVVWTQRSGRDWTVEAFLVSDEGVGLDVAKDAATKRSIMASLPILADTPLSRLSGRLEAEDFDRLMVGDQPRDLLRWMSDPGGARETYMGEGKWHAFCNRCREDYGFDPEADGELTAGERLGLHEDAAWTSLWRRFCESPAAYPGIPDLLTRSKPVGTLAFVRESWPDENREAETRLRDVLVALDGAEASVARARIDELEQEHAPRRRWVWSRLGLAPLALALEHLARLAERTASHVGGESPEEMAALYAEGGFLADDAAIRSLAAVRSAADAKAVSAAVRAVYLPWLEAAAERLQRLSAGSPLPYAGQQPLVTCDAETCILFADGLRFDLAQRVVAACEERSLQVRQHRRWAALPSVTATAKPAVSPVADRIRGVDLPETFAPDIDATGQSLTAPRFRRLLEEAGYQVISAGECGDPGKKSARGWAEFGQIDRRGHDLKAALAGQLEDELDRLTERIVELIDAGWRAVRVVTDHGWLLVPGGLPRHDLPRYLVECKWSRCAAIKGASKVSVPTAGWHWNHTAEFALAPGACCFSAGHEYAHGGVSLQECLVADLLVQPGADTSGGTASIVDAQWLGLRCRLTVEPANTTWSVDIRTKPASPSSSVAVSAKRLDEGGRAGLVVEDEDLAGAAAVLVVLDPEGRVLTKQPTTVGGGD